MLQPANLWQYETSNDLQHLLDVSLARYCELQMGHRLNSFCRELVVQRH